MPLLFFYLLALCSLHRWWQADSEKAKQKELLLTGVWLGIAFGMKYTAASFIATVFMMFAYVAWGGAVLVGLPLVFLGIFGMAGFSFYLQSFDSGTQDVIHWVELIVGLVLTAYPIIKGKHFMKKVTPIFLVGGMITLLILPWWTHNIVTSDKLTMDSLLRGNAKKISITVGDSGGSCEPFKVKNETDLYAGGHDVHSLLWPVTTLWAVSLNDGIPHNRLVDISFLFMGFLVFGILGWSEARKENKELDKVLLFTALYGFLWLFTSRGIIWYGMPIFIGVLWIYGALWRTEKWPYIVLAVWFAMSLNLKYQDSVTRVETVLYAGGLTPVEILADQGTNGSYDIAQILNSPENKDAKIYLGGRFIQYYIEGNDRRIYIDRQLDTFDCQVLDEDPGVTLDRLRDNGFEYVIFMEDALTLERDDPNGPLHRRFAKAEAFLENHLNRLVYRPQIRLYEVPK